MRSNTKISSATRTPYEPIEDEPIIAVLRASAAQKYAPVVDVLVTEGIRVVELTLSTPGTIRELQSLKRKFGDAAGFGVGTICTLSDAQQAIAAGADFLVTPIIVPEIIELAVSSNIPVYPGGLSPTEIYTAWSLGASAVKLFPAETVGPRYAEHLRGPFPDLQFVPSGGIKLEEIRNWLDAGAKAVSLGGPLIGDALRGGSLVDLATRVQRARTLAKLKEAIK